METVLLIDADADRRRSIRSALEARGMDVTGEAGSIAEVIGAVAALDHAPTTILIGARVAGADSNRVARLIKRTWPRATVVHEMTTNERERESSARRLRAAVAG